MRSSVSPNMWNDKSWTSAKGLGDPNRGSKTQRRICFESKNDQGRPLPNIYSTLACLLSWFLFVWPHALQAEENKGEYMEEMLKKIKEHEAYVSKVSFNKLYYALYRSHIALCSFFYIFTIKVRSNQEDRLKPYFAELEVNIKVLSFRTCWWFCPLGQVRLIEQWTTLK